MKMRPMQVRVAVFAAILSCLAAPAWAGSSNDTDSVTVLTPTILSITDTVGNFTLTMTDMVSGSVSNRQTVIYTVKGNNYATTALAGALSAKVSALLSGIRLKGDPAASSTNNGTAGNILLTESAAGDIAVGTTAVNFMDKGATVAPQGKVLNGSVGVSWVAVADRDLSATDGGTVTLTVTIKDA